MLPTFRDISPFTFSTSVLSWGRWEDRDSNLHRADPDLRETAETRLQLSSPSKRKQENLHSTHHEVSRAEADYYHLLNTLDFCFATPPPPDHKSFLHTQHFTFTGICRQDIHNISTLATQPRVRLHKAICSDDILLAYIRGTVAEAWQFRGSWIVSEFWLLYVDLFWSWDAGGQSRGIGSFSCHNVSLRPPPPLFSSARMVRTPCNHDTEPWNKVSRRSSGRDTALMCSPRRWFHPSHLGSLICYIGGLESGNCFARSSPKRTDNLSKTFNIYPDKTLTLALNSPQPPGHQWLVSKQPTLLNEESNHVWKEMTNQLQKRQHKVIQNRDA